MMNELICPHCGKENPPDAEFCENCLNPLPRGVPRDAASPAEDVPDWLHKIREKNKTESPGTPPLGEFGDAEQRPFGEGAVPGEIPDWLSELQKNEKPKPPEPTPAESDWVSRLHEILPESDRQALQSTTFYTEEELAAMAAAARQLEPAEYEPPEKASTQPLGIEPASAPTDFAFSSSGGSEPPGITEPPAGSASQPTAHIPEEEPQIPETWLPAQESEKKVDEEPVLREKVNPAVSTVVPDRLLGEASLPADSVPGEIGKAVIDRELYMPFASEQADSTPEENAAPNSPAGKEEPAREETPAVEKPEELIPEGILQPQYNRSVEYSGRLELSDAQRASIAQLKSMLVGEIQAQIPVQNKDKFGGRTLRLVIGVLLLIVMLFPLITGYTLTGQQALFSPGVVVMHKTIAALPENAPFLIITDYEPAFSSELKAAANGVLESLMMKGMNFSILSTIPTGPALAHDLITSVRSGILAYPPEKIAYLGYLPGGTTGLRDFIRGPRQSMPLMEDARYAWTYPASQEVNTIQDYAGILIITENTEIGRAWIEQLHDSMAGKPVLMVVSAQSAPLMRPYLDSDQLNGLIGGRVEGAMYDRIMEFPPRSTNVTAAYQAGMLLAAFLVFVGGLFGILKGLFNRRTPSSTEDWHVG